MRECAQCHTTTSDDIVICSNCGADLLVDSVSARALKALLDSPRVRHISIVTPDPACPICRTKAGTIAKDSDVLPVLPHEGCSCPNGCTCRYEPLVVEVGP